jgi:F-type H+-transporting ATPase subunit b
MPQLDISTYAPQIIWLVITFVILFLVMWKVIVPRISDALEVRQRRIEYNLARAAELQKEAEAVLEAYDASLANVLMPRR